MLPINSIEVGTQQAQMNEETLSEESKVKRLMSSFLW